MDLGLSFEKIEMGTSYKFFSESSELIGLNLTIQFKATVPLERSFYNTTKIIISI